MAGSKFYVGLEIGTSKVCIVVGEARPDGAIKILGVGQFPAAGVRKGEVVDPEAVQTCLHEALVNAEERAGVDIGTVYLSVSGSHVHGVNNRGTLTISDEEVEIGIEDLDEVKKIARDVAIPKENGFIHSIVSHYYVDGQEKVLNPLGMLGRTLEADYHIIHGVKTRIQNSIRSVRETSLEIEDIVFSPVASSQVVLDREAKNLGALLLDIGGGTTDYICMVDNAVEASGCIGLGGDHITNDIALVLKIPLARAEKLKVTSGSASLKNLVEREIPIEGETGKMISQRLLNEIMHARVAELLNVVKERLDEQGLRGRLGKGVYITGGSSLMRGIDKVAEEILELPVHRGGESTMSGPTALFENPQYATCVGLIRYAQLLDEQRPASGPLSRLGQKFEKLFRAKS